MKIFTSPPPIGGINFTLLCEQAQAAWATGLLGIGVNQDGSAVIILSDSVPVGQAEVDALVAAHDAEQDSAAKQAQDATATALVGLLSIDASAGSVSFDAETFAKLIVATRGC